MLTATWEKEDFALIEASYAVVRILQRFPNMRMPVGQAYEKTGSERQKMTLVIAVEDGCVVQLE